MEGDASELEVADRFGPIAEAQAGLVTVEQALAAGLTRADCKSLVRARRWLRVSYSLYRTAGTGWTWEQRVWGACLETGGYASHRTAAHLFQLDGVPPGPPTELEVLLAHGNRRTSDLAIVRRSRSFHPTHIYKGEGIPRTNLPRTLIDLADVLEEKKFEEAFDCALRRVPDLRPWLRRLLKSMPRGGQHPGRALLDKLVADRRPALDSALEVKVRQLLREHAFPEPRTGYETTDDEGYLAKLDFAWPDHTPPIALLVHGWRFHGKDKKWNNDIDQSSAFSVLRWVLIQCSYKTVVNNPALVVRRLRRAFATTPTT